MNLSDRSLYGPSVGSNFANDFRVTTNNKKLYDENCFSILFKKTKLHTQNCLKRSV